MKIERLVISNWMPFAGRQALDLPSGPIAVTATYKGNPRRSNWGGKTALLEAIEWALFGVHRKRYEDDVIHGREQETSVSMHLTGDIVITRSRRRGKPTKLIVEVEGVGFAKKEAQAKINELLGFDADDYRATICFAQGDTSAIVDRTSGDRRKIVGQWLELEAWLRVTARIRIKARKTMDAITSTRATLKALDDHFDDAGYLHDEEVMTGDPIVDRAHALGSINGIILRTRLEIYGLEEKLEAIAELEVKRLDRDRFRRLGKEAGEIKSTITGADPVALRVEIDHARTQYESEAGDHRIASERYDSAKAFKRGEFDGQCPITCEECGIADTVRTSRDAAAARFEQARDALLEAETEAKAARATLRDVEGKEKALERARATYAEKLKEARAIQPSALAYDAENELEAAEITALRTDMTELRAHEIDAVRDLTRAQAREHRITRIGEDILRVRADLEELEDLAAARAVALRCVGPAGVPARIAEASLSHLEDRANVLLEESGLSFTFAWDRETRDVTPVCFECGYTYKGKRDKKCPACDAPRAMKRADELEILVDDGSGEIEDVKAKSGGAKVLVGAAIRLAAGLMLRELRGSPAAWAQIDEPFGPLDAENRATLAQTFAGLLGAVGLEQAFVVSHDSALLDALPSRLEIVRDGNVSTVSVR